jgi:hypothetical protein
MCLPFLNLERIHGFAPMSLFLFEYDINSVTFKNEAIFLCKLYLKRTIIKILTLIK